MQVTVFHRDNFDPRVESGFTRMAVVQAPTDCVEDALNYAYRWTNNLHGSWSRDDIPENGDYNELVEFVGELEVGKDGTVYGVRSTSMGDVMFCDGEKYEVAMAGFKALCTNKGCGDCNP